MLCGASGSGKTWLACELGVAACNVFLSVRYTRLPELFDELCAQGRGVGEGQEAIRALRRADN